MNALGQALRRRAEEIGLTDSEVARRVGLEAGRYGNYVRGTREPDFATFKRICRVLMTTPNVLLEFEESFHTKHPRANAALDLLDEDGRDLAVGILETMVEHRRRRGE